MNNEIDVLEQMRARNSNAIVNKLREMDKLLTQTSRTATGQGDLSVAQFRLYADFSLSAAGKVVTIIPRESQLVSLYGDDGYNNYVLPASLTLDFTTGTSGKKHAMYLYVDPIATADTTDNAKVVAEFEAWTNETTRATALVSTEGVMLKSGNTSRRWIGDAYFDGTYVYIQGGIDELSGRWYGTGDPNNMSGGTTTGYGFQVPGVLINSVRYNSFTIKNDVLQVGFNTDGELVFGANAGRLSVAGMGLKSDTYPAAALIEWKSTDTSVVTGQLISDYGGAAVNTGLRVIGQAHDSGVKGYAALWAQDHNGVLKSSFYVQSDGTSVLEFEAGTGAGTQTLYITAETSATNVPNVVLSIGTKSTGTVANGLGTAMEYYIENSTGVNKQAGYEEMTWLDKTNASEDTQYRVVLKTAGADVAAITLTGEAASFPGTLGITGRLSASGFINIGGGVAATISAGVITATSSFMTVDTQGGAATDDLDTINGGGNGDILILQSTANARDIVCKDLTGNMNLAGDFTLTTIISKLTLLRDGGIWQELSRAN